VLLVLDATTGQNGLHQARVFHETVGVSGIVVTKMDSTARAGIVFAIVGELQLPVLFLGTGESLDDLVPFDPRGFVTALFED
jgi:fused signal recognition particle receptor